MIKLYKHQKEAIDKLKNGSILCGGVGTGKSITSLVYFFNKVCGGDCTSSEFRPMRNPKSLFIITTARKRDTLEWEKECAKLSLSKGTLFQGVGLLIDSWNNIKKYTDVKDAFFIFDEQRVVGSGTWVKSFLKITKQNQWILLSATPGDVWMDYAPIFIANGFYKNRSDFIARHVIYNRMAKYPKIERYYNEERLRYLRDSVLVMMEYTSEKKKHSRHKVCPYDGDLYLKAQRDRWNVFENTPIKDAGELCYILRRIVNNSYRLETVKDILKQHKKVIVFYNFNYELELLKSITGVDIAEWNGHIHEPIPRSDSWLYLVQYAAGAEGWNCIETNTIIFFSMNYSYKAMIQAAGRIDRINTPFNDLYYYILTSKSSIDKSIEFALKNKKNFNIDAFASSQKLHTL